MNTTSRVLILAGLVCLALAAILVAGAALGWWPLP